MTALGCARTHGRWSRRRWLLPVVVNVLLAALSESALAADVLVVVSSDREPYWEAEAVLRQELTARGHSVRDANLAVLSSGEERLDTTDACVAIGTDAARWLDRRRRTGLVKAYCMVADPEGLGLGEAGAFPGVTTDIPLAAQFRLIQEVLPQARRVGMVFRSESDLGRRTVAAVRRQLPAGWDLAAVPVEKHESFSAALDEMFDQGIEVVWTSPDPGVYDAASVRALLLAALRRHVPVFGFSPPFVRAGALLGVGVSPQAQGKQAANLVDELLSSPARRSQLAAGRLAVRHPEFEIVLNLVVAEKLSLQIPDEVVSRANHVVGK